ncbi:hypothetical protein BGZ63DRAFT_449883 [Mariannaea sp. PMI_226]|nr:hypothetical protein BGZ63DRAFT_449883 [Mariannaea sp. PMI_226]
MRFTTLSVLGAFCASTYAAECLGNTYDQLEQYEKAYIDARQHLCGGTVCPDNEDCAAQVSLTTTSPLGAGPLAKHMNVTVEVIISRKSTTGVGGFKDCWEATMDIIQSCKINQRKEYGYWLANDQLYVMDTQTSSVTF